MSLASPACVSAPVALALKPQSSAPHSTSLRLSQPRPAGILPHVCSWTSGHHTGLEWQTPGLRQRGIVDRSACSPTAEPRHSSKLGAASEAAAAEPAEAETFPKLKEFLKDLEGVGRVRIIVNSGMGVLESVTTLEGLFCVPYGGKGEWANVMKPTENVDFHLLLPQVAKVELATGKARTGDFVTYSARFYDKSGANGASIYVFWKPGTQGEYDLGQVEAFEKLVEKYGEELIFQ